MFKHKSKEEQEFKKIHTNHLLKKYIMVSLEDSVFPKELAPLYKLRFYESCKKNKIVLPEEIKGNNLGKVRKISKWSRSLKEPSPQEEEIKQQSGTFSCNNCFRYMVPGQGCRIYLSDDNDLIQKCNYCGYELKRKVALPTVKESSKSALQEKTSTGATLSKKQRNKNKNKLIMQQKMRQKQAEKPTSSLNLMDFLK